MNATSLKSDFYRQQPNAEKISNSNPNVNGGSQKTASLSRAKKISNSISIT